MSPTNRNSSTNNVFNQFPNALVFITFSVDNRAISAIDFFKLCKMLKVYPVCLSFSNKSR
jgi:hypothetical protein